MANDLHFPIGSVSTGTHVSEDLVCAFDDAAEDLAAYIERADGAEVRARFDDMYNELSVAFRNAHTYEEQEDILHDLIDTLDAYCPSFTRVGTHEGDGADFGFWPAFDFDDMDDADRARFSVNDHGNVALYDRAADDDGARVIWAIV